MKRASEEKPPVQMQKDGGFLDKGSGEDSDEK